MLLALFPLTVLLVLDMNTNFVHGAGGTLTIQKPATDGYDIAWNSSVTIKYTATPDSGYEVEWVDTYINDVKVRTHNARGSDKNGMTKEWDADNPGLGPNEIKITAVFSKDFIFYYETEYRYFDSTGTIYKERFNSIGSWTLSTYDDEGDESDEEDHYSSSCSSGTAYVLEDTDAAVTFALLIDSLSLSDWSQWDDIEITIKHRSTSTSSSAYCTNTFLAIWGSTGDPLDTYFYRYTNEATTDTGWVTRSYYLDKDDFSSLTSLTISVGYKDAIAADFDGKVDVDYIEIHYDG